MRLALNVAWIAGSVYASIPPLWLLIHPLVPFWSRRKGPVMPYIGFIWLALIALLAFAVSPWREARLYSTPYSWLAWLALFIAGLVIYRQAGSFGLARVLGQAEVRPAEHEQKLITTGLHARMRHPIYLGHLLMLTAWTVGAGTLALFILWGFAAIAGAIMIRSEECELRSRFGAQWEQYTTRVPMIFPRI
jgi:protein-S-isoprenylcysteine O-methyltransferase Ste14